MERFIALIFDPGDTNAAARACAWSAPFSCSPWTGVIGGDGLAIFVRARKAGPANWALLSGGVEGVVLGHAFRRGQEGLGRANTLTPEESTRIAESRGERLMRDFWGGYVAIWRERRDGQASIMRDPCGALPCFVTEQDGVFLAFSHAEDIADLPGVRLTIDWRFLAAFLVHNKFVTRHTGLAEVKELLAGERMDIEPGSSISSSSSSTRRAFVWNGAEIAREAKARAFASVRDELRATANACFAAWGSTTSKSLVSLSGGFDSSVVVNLLRRAARADVHALHFVGMSYERYEVDLARQAAAYAGIPLIEARLDPHEDDLSVITTGPRLARPKKQVLAVLTDRLAEQLATEIGADSFMLGQGGDNLFLQRGLAQHGLTDRLRMTSSAVERGPSIAAIAYDTAVLNRSSIWRAGRQAIAQALTRPPWRPFSVIAEAAWMRHHLFADGVLENIDRAYQVHPWLDEASTLAPGKAEHLASIVTLYDYYIHHGRGLERDVTYPLISQPIVELVLRTPSYVLTEGGIDRAIARAAFADILPEAIVRRTAKGGADHYSLRVFERNLPFYRSMLLDGQLIKTGWLDRAKLERALSMESAIAGKGTTFLKLALAAEAWLATWRFTA